MGFLHSVTEICRNNPSILLFAALSLGYAFGKLRFGSFSFGSTTGVLLVAMTLGILLLKNTTFDLGIIKSVSFALFIFTVGYKVGPDFVGGLKRGGTKYLVIAIFFTVTALGVALVVIDMFHLNGAYGAGIVAGALTQSAIIGTADGAIMHLESGAQTLALNLKSDVAIACAVTYLFGTAGLILLLKVLPSIWKIDLRKSAQDAEKEMGNLFDEDSVSSFHWSNLVSPRAYLLTNPETFGKSVSELESSFPGTVYIERIERGGTPLDTDSGRTTLKMNDVLLLMGHTPDLLKAAELVGPEVDTETLKHVLGEVLDICVTSKKYTGITLGSVFSRIGHGCFVLLVRRQAHDLPVNPGLTVFSGDVIRVIGAKEDTERLAQQLGYPERETGVTDLIAVGAGIIAGILIGLLSVNLWGIPVTLGAGGGVLVSGLFAGWLRSRKPVWGRIPVSAQWLLTDLGLKIFIACIGLSAGSRAVAALKEAGPEILIAGVIITILPHLITWLFGLYTLKLNPVLLLGAMSGAGTCTSALNSVKEDCGSSLPVIGYTVPYAIGNVLLTVMGALIVNII